MFWLIFVLSGFHSAHAQAPLPVQCFNLARTQMLSEAESLRLCSGMDSLGPIQCYNRATSLTLLSHPQAIELCRCSPTTSPVDCFNSARNSTSLDTPKALKLCEGSKKYSLEAQACLGQVGETEINPRYAGP